MFNNYYNTQECSTDPQKILIVERLIKEGHVTLAEGLVLLKREISFSYPVITGYYYSTTGQTITYDPTQTPGTITFNDNDPQ